MMKFFVPNSRNSLFRGILTIALGCILLFVPGLTMQTVIIIIGTMLLLSGLVTLILSNRKKARSVNGFWSAQGIMTILFGIVFIASPSVMVKVFVVFLGIILLILGFFQLLSSLGTLIRSAWGWIYFLIALMTFGSGIFLLTDPFKSAEAILAFLGVILILNGLSELFMAWKVSHQPQTYKGTPVEDVTYEEV
ncbi:MAG: hypothetical protein GZ094_14735 [Mariniphaga sp.]|nr:hypothetical protein [Mariniphaga sp.]